MILAGARAVAKSARHAVGHDYPMPRIEPLQPDELANALARLLATPGSQRLAPRQTVQAFVEYVESCALKWEGFRIGARQSCSALLLALLLPGSTAIILVPSPDELGIELAAQRDLTRAVLDRLRERKLHYAQALLLPAARGQRCVLEEAGLRFLAPLTYLERDANFPWVDPPQVDAGAWVTFSPQTYDEFAATLVETYRDSRDCPELCGLRPVNDIIAGHQASGRFDPALWQLLRRDGRNMACLLLAPLATASIIEVVYMGVVPDYRRRGVGSLLLQRALERCRETRASRLTLVVDDRNEPAKRLYQRFALTPVTRRDAWLYRWPPATAPPDGTAA